MDASPLLAEHRRRGLRLAQRPEAPTRETPLFFASPPEEYAAARAGAALLDLSDHGRLEVHGKDAADFLHRLTANHVKTLAPGAVRHNALLTPKGKLQFVFECRRSETGFALELAPDQAAPLAQALERYHFSEDVAFTDASAQCAPLELEGPRAAALLSACLASTELPAPLTHRSLTWRARPLGVLALGPQRFRLEPGPDGVLALWSELVAAGATPTGLVVREARRIEAGRPLGGVDLDENVYPQEAGLEASFALDKGCYVGQEVVAKIDTYGGLNKRLLVLAVDHSDPVARGTRLWRVEDGERRELGLVTSWAYSFAHDTGLVLAYVKRRHQAEGTEFELEQSGRARVIAPPV